MKTKLICLAVVIAVFLGLYGLDWGIARSYRITVVNIDAQTIVADGQQIVNVEIKVERGGKPVEGHEIFAMAYGGGRFIKPRINTNADGVAVFQYQTYRSTRFTPAGEVNLSFEDYSNSVFIRVPAKSGYSIMLSEPDKA